jgi:hypothetical protein
MKREESQPQRRPTLEDFARIRIGSSRVVSREGAIVQVNEFDSDTKGIFVAGVCQEHVPGSDCDKDPGREPIGCECEVRWLDIVEVRT